MANTYQDLTGMTFGRWEVLGEAEPKYYRGRRIRYWNCKCECGTEKAVKEQSLLSNRSQSCGCYHSDIMHDVGKAAKTTHGRTDTRLYRIYHHIVNRCTNPNDIRYNQYGARGITICDEWSSFEGFAQWADESGYRDDLSIDRKDVDKGYSPDNCRWSTAYEQAINKTSTQYLEFNGEKKCIAEWAKALNMPYKKLWKRVNSGWPAERALTTP